MYSFRYDSYSLTELTESPSQYSDRSSNTPSAQTTGDTIYHRDITYDYQMGPISDYSRTGCYADPSQTSCSADYNVASGLASQGEYQNGMMDQDAPTSPYYPLFGPPMRHWSETSPRVASSSHVAMPQNSVSTRPAKKRKRFFFNAHQQRKLLAQFEVNEYIAKREREALTAEIGVPERQSRDWFANRRQLVRKEVQRKVEAFAESNSLVGKTADELAAEIEATPTEFRCWLENKKRNTGKREKAAAVREWLESELEKRKKKGRQEDASAETDFFAWAQ